MNGKLITHEEARKELEAFQKMIGLRLDKVEQYITQQEQFAKDVARYFYLENLTDDKYTVEVGIEHHALREKLSKVGKEE